MAINIGTNTDGDVTYKNPPVDRVLFPNIKEGASLEEIQEAVDAWLDDHPEATTTVEDGSILPVKLDSTNSATDGYVLSYNATEGKFEWYDIGGELDEINSDITDLKQDINERINRVTSANLFNKDDTVVGRLTTTKGEYNTAFASYNASTVIELEEEITSPVFYTTEKPAELFTWNAEGVNNGTLSYSNFSDADNGHGYKSAVLTGARVKYLAISWRVSSTYAGSGYIDTSAFVLSTSELSGEYIPYNNYPTLYGKRAALFSEIPTVPTVIPQFEQTTSTFVGTDSGKYNVEGSESDAGKYNTGVGTKALNANISGSHNTALGFQAMGKNTTGSSNTGLGEDSLYECTTGSQNTGAGVRTLQNLTTGSRNTAVGAIAGYEITTGSQNTFVGQNTGNNVTTESNNTCVGYWSGVSAGVENSTALGRGATATKSNQVVLGNANVTETLLRGDIVIVSGGVYHKLVFNSDGTVSWTDVTP